MRRDVGCSECGESLLNIIVLHMDFSSIERCHLGRMNINNVSIKLSRYKQLLTKLIPKNGQIFQRFD